MRILVGVALLCGALALPTQQTDQPSMPDAYREVQIRQLEAQRTMLVAMADSMPGSLYRDRATPSQRDFANQLFHAANGVVQFTRVIVARPLSIEVDTVDVLNEPAAMRDYLNEVFDLAVTTVRTQPTAQRNEMVEGPGRMMPRWQLWDEIHQHTMWTAGQVVANFRKHGMVPPPFVFF